MVKHESVNVVYDYENFTTSSSVCRWGNSRKYC